MADYAHIEQEAQARLHLSPRFKSGWQEQVEEYLRRIGRLVPHSPRLAPSEVLAVWGRLLLEEVFEYLEAADCQVLVKPEYVHSRPLEFNDLWVQPPAANKPTNNDEQLVGVVDALCDISFVATGGLSVNGVADAQVQDLVNYINHERALVGARNPLTGKYEKPKDFPKPPIHAALLEQRRLCAAQEPRHEF